MNKKDIIGKSYELATMLKFKVLNVTTYPMTKVSRRYEHILTIKPGHLVAINYRGTLIPNLTLEDGVVRLTSVEIDGKTITKPKAISSALGIGDTMDIYPVKKLG